MKAEFQEVPPPCSPSSFPLPAHVWTLCALQLCLPGSIVVPEQARFPVRHVSAPAGLKSSCSRSPSLQNDERSSPPPQAIQPLDRRPSGAGEHVCFSPPLLQIKQVIMFNFTRQQLTASAEEPAECAAKSNFHLQGGWITSKLHAFPCSTADLVTLVLYFFK